MNIGIIKLGQPVYFYDDSKDFASWSIEVINIYEIFKQYGHIVHILTETDLSTNENGPFLNRYDRIYVFNGYDESRRLQLFLERSDDIRLIITDLRLIKDIDVSIFKRIYTQSPKYCEFLPPVGQLFNYTKKSYSKTNKIYFGGGMRNRQEDFLEYVYRPNILYKAKILLPGFISDNRVGFSEHLELLSKSKYSITIGDIEYNKIGFITPRYYECIKYDVICFMNSTFDKYEKQMKKNNLRRVSSFVEMIEKIDYLENNLIEYNLLLEKQREEIKESYISGKDLYDRLI